MSLPLPAHAAGLGLRRGLIDELLAMRPVPSTSSKSP